MMETALPTESTQSARTGESVRPTIEHLVPIVSAEWLTRHDMCPVRHLTDETSISVLAREHTEPSDLAEFAFVTGISFEVATVSADVLERAIERYRRMGEQDALTDLFDNNDDAADADARGLATQPPVVRYVNLLARDAVALQASDIHLEATRGGLTTRFRIDGVLSDGPPAPAGMHNAVVSRCKLLAGLDISERRKPQDGRIRMRLDERELDLRVSTVPTLHGESVVIRLLDRGDRPVELRELGMPAAMLTRAIDVISRPHGLVLVTGPTGSGKTTTLYAALAHRSADSEKLITVEDPVEYQIPRVTQVPVHHGAGVSFASALRAILRQDPDVLLIGELRDEETAAVAIQASMTGHLVLATLHTNDAVSAFTRLLDLQIPPFLLVDTVSAVIAQRLVRRVCAKCVCAAELSIDDISWLRAHGKEYEPQTFIRGAGCAECRGTGYRGRVGVFECVVVSEQVRTAIANGVGRDALLDVVRNSADFQPLVRDALAKALAGITTFDEVRRVAVE